MRASDYTVWWAKGVEGVASIARRNETTYTSPRSPRAPKETLGGTGGKTNKMDRLNEGKLRYVSRATGLPSLLFLTERKRDARSNECFSFVASHVSHLETEIDGPSGGFHGEGVATAPRRGLVQGHVLAVTVHKVSGRQTSDAGADHRHLIFVPPVHIFLIVRLAHRRVAVSVDAFF